jgi:hypothetical protein
VKTKDYFEEKIQLGMELLIEQLVDEWKNLNPHEPALQAEIEKWGVEFLNYARQHPPIKNKALFAFECHHSKPAIHVELKIPRAPQQY